MASKKVKVSAPKAGMSSLVGKFFTKQAESLLDDVMKELKNELKKSLKAAFFDKKSDVGLIKNEVNDAAKSINNLNDLEISPEVDHTNLTKLNEHLDLKVSHLKEVIAFFKNNPIVAEYQEEGNVSNRSGGSGGSGGIGESLSQQRSDQGSLKAISENTKSIAEKQISPEELVKHSEGIQKVIIESNAISKDIFATAITASMFKAYSVTKGAALRQGVDIEKQFDSFADLALNKLKEGQVQPVENIQSVENAVKELVKVQKQQANQEKSARTVKSSEKRESSPASKNKIGKFALNSIEVDLSDVRATLNAALNTLGINSVSFVNNLSKAIDRIETKVLGAAGEQIAEIAEIFVKSVDLGVAALDAALFGAGTMQTVEEGVGYKIKQLKTKNVAALPRSDSPEKLSTDYRAKAQEFNKTSPIIKSFSKAASDPNARLRNDTITQMVKQGPELNQRALKLRNQIADDISVYKQQLKSGTASDVNATQEAVAQLSKNIKTLDNFLKNYQKVVTDQGSSVGDRIKSYQLNQALNLKDKAASVVKSDAFAELSANLIGTVAGKMGAHFGGVAGQVIASYVAETLTKVAFKGQMLSADELVQHTQDFAAGNMMASAFPTPIPGLSGTVGAMLGNKILKFLDSTKQTKNQESNELINAQKNLVNLAKDFALKSTGNKLDDKLIPRLSKEDAPEFANGAYDSSDNTIALSAELKKALSTNTLSKEQKEIVVEEIAHSIQFGFGKLLSQHKALNQGKDADYNKLAKDATSSEIKSIARELKNYKRAGAPSQVIAYEADAKIAAKRYVNQSTALNRKEESLAYARKDDDSFTPQPKNKKQSVKKSKPLFSKEIREAIAAAKEEDRKMLEEMLANQSSDRGQYLKSLQEASEPQYKEEEAILAKFTAEQNAMRKAVARQKKKRLKRDRQYNQSQPLAAPLFEVEKNKSYASTPIEYTKKDSDGKIHILPAKALKELSRGTKNLFKSHSKMLDDYMAMYEQELQYVTSKQIARERARKRLEKNASKYTRKERKEYEIGRMSEEVNSVVDVYKEKSGANYNNYNQAIAAGITLLVGGFKEVAAIAAIFPNMVALAPILSSMLAIKSILGDLGRVSIEAALNLEKSNLAFKNTSLSLSEANNIPLGNTLQDLSRDKGESNKRVVDSMAERKSASIAQARDLFANIQGATIGSKSPTRQKDNLAITEGLTTAFAATGISTEAQKRAVNAITQMQAKGVIMAEELRGQLAEAMPAAIGIMADSLGVSTDQLMKMSKAGELIASEVLPKFARELQKTFGSDEALKDFKNSFIAATVNLENSQLKVDELFGDPNNVIVGFGKMFTNLKAMALSSFADLGTLALSGILTGLVSIGSTVAIGVQTAFGVDKIEKVVARVDGAFKTVFAGISRIYYPFAARMIVDIVEDIVGTTKSATQNIGDFIKNLGLIFKNSFRGVFSSLNNSIAEGTSKSKIEKSVAANLESAGIISRSDEKTPKARKGLLDPVLSFVDKNTSNEGLVGAGKNIAKSAGDVGKTIVEFGTLFMMLNQGLRLAYGFVKPQMEAILDSIHKNRLLTRDVIAKEGGIRRFLSDTKETFQSGGVGAVAQKAGSKVGEGASKVKRNLNKEGVQKGVGVLTSTLSSFSAGLGGVSSIASIAGIGAMSLAMLALSYSKFENEQSEAAKKIIENNKSIYESFRINYETLEQIYSKPIVLKMEGKALSPKEAEDLDNKTKEEYVAKKKEEGKIVDEKTLIEQQGIPLLPGFNSDMLIDYLRKKLGSYDRISASNPSLGAIPSTIDGVDGKVYQNSNQFRAEETLRFAEQIEKRQGISNGTFASIRSQGIAIGARDSHSGRQALDKNLTAIAESASLAETQLKGLGLNLTKVRKADGSVTNTVQRVGDGAIKTEARAQDLKLLNEQRAALLKASNKVENLTSDRNKIVAQGGSTTNIDKAISDALAIRSEAEAEVVKTETRLSVATASFVDSVNSVTASLAGLKLGIDQAQLTGNDKTNLIKATAERMGLDPESITTVSDIEAVIKSSPGFLAVKDEANKASKEVNSASKYQSTVKQQEKDEAFRARELAKKKVDINAASQRVLPGLSGVEQAKANVATIKLDATELRKAEKDLQNRVNLQRVTRNSEGELLSDTEEGQETLQALKDKQTEIYANSQELKTLEFQYQRSEIDRIRTLQDLANEKRGIDRTLEDFVKNNAKQDYDRAKSRQQQELDREAKIRSIRDSLEDAEIQSINERKAALTALNNSSKNLAYSKQDTSLIFSEADKSVIGDSMQSLRSIGEALNGEATNQLDIAKENLDAARLQRDMFLEMEQAERDRLDQVYRNILEDEEIATQRQRQLQDMAVQLQQFNRTLADNGMTMENIGNYTIQAGDQLVNALASVAAKVAESSSAFNTPLPEADTPTDLPTVATNTVNAASSSEALRVSDARSLPKKIAFGAGHWDNHAGNGTSGNFRESFNVAGLNSTAEQVATLFMMKAFKAEASKRGYEVEDSASMDRTQSLGSRVRRLDELEKKGFYSVDLHFDTAAGKSGIIANRNATEKADVNLAKAYGNFGYSHREGQLGMVNAGNTILEISPLMGRFEAALKEFKKNNEKPLQALAASEAVKFMNAYEGKSSGATEQRTSNQTFTSSAVSNKPSLNRLHDDLKSNQKFAESAGALASALIIAAGEAHQWILNDTKHYNKLWSEMGGDKNDMQGAFQWNLRDHDRRKLDTKEEYFDYTANALTGRSPVPTGARRFNPKKLEDAVKSGQIATEEQLLKYLQKQFTINDWHGLHKSGGGEDRIKQSGVLSWALKSLRGGSTPSSTVASSSSNPTPTPVAVQTFPSVGERRANTIANNASNAVASTSVPTSTDANYNALMQERAEEQAKREAERKLNQTLRALNSEYEKKVNITKAENNRLSQSVNLFDRAQDDRVKEELQTDNVTQETERIVRQGGSSDTNAYEAEIKELADLSDQIEQLRAKSTEIITTSLANKEAELQGIIEVVAAEDQVKKLKDETDLKNRKQIEEQGQKTKETLSQEIKALSAKGDNQATIEGLRKSLLETYNLTEEETNSYLAGLIYRLAAGEETLAQANQLETQASSLEKRKSSVSDRQTREKQKREEAFKLDYESFNLERETRDPYSKFDNNQTRRRFKNDFNRQKLEDKSKIDSFEKEGLLSPEAAKAAREQIDSTRESVIAMNAAIVESNPIAGQFSEGLMGVISGAKSLGEVFAGIGQTILDTMLKVVTDSIAVQFSNMFSGLFAGIFGGGAAAAPKPPVAVATGYIPAYANGCLPNYATGGGYQRAMQSEASQDIGTPFLAVINSRESVLSAKNGDSQAYAEMVKNGSWDEVKAQYGNSSYQQTNIDKLVTNNSFSQGANYQDTKMDKLVMNLSKGSISYSSSAMPNLSGGYIPNFASGRIASGYSSNYSSMPTSNVSSNSNQTSNSNVKIVTNQNINYNIAKENAKGLSESQIRKAEKQAQTKASRIV